LNPLLKGVWGIIMYVVLSKFVSFGEYPAVSAAGRFIVPHSLGKQALSPYLKRTRSRKSLAILKDVIEGKKPKLIQKRNVIKKD